MSWSVQIKFEHIILTRFNLKLECWKKDKKGNSVDTEEWLKSRFFLFEKYCLPSIKNQTNQNFKWIVVFDHTTPERFRSIIDHYNENYKNFFPIYTDHSSHLKEIINEIVSDSEYLISTRIDNDDAFHKNTIKIIQKQFKGQNFDFVNLLKGYILDTIKNKIYLAKEDSNPFITLIEKKMGCHFKTVFSVNHKAAGRLGKIKQVKRGIYWLRTIHDRNLLNAVKGRELRKAVDLKYFNLGCND